MRGKLTDFFIAWASPALANAYRTSDLSPRDTERATLARSARAQHDWQVSRALLHSVHACRPGRVHSLSHKHGHAVCAVAPAHWRIGVDVERIRARDVMRLADWVCCEQEKQALADLTGQYRLTHFYLLWTLKEAFIKAADLRFPADMVRVGLTTNGTGSAAILRAPPGGWQACAWHLESDWIVSTVWQADTVSTQPPDWHTPASSAQRHMLGQWRTDWGPNRERQSTLRSPQSNAVS